MKNHAAWSLVLAFVATIAGCARPLETATVDVNHENTSDDQQMQGERDENVEHGYAHRGQADHGHHQHAFTDPEKLAAKLNAPERDEWQHPEQIVSALALQPGSTVADIGAGTGYMVAHLSKAVGENGTVIALDAEEAMIAYLTKQSERLGPATVIPRKVSRNSPELQPASVDGVVTIDTWHHMDSREEYARKVYAGLKRGGRFIVVDYDVNAASGPPVEMRLEPDRVVKELEAAGFRVELAQESMPRHYMVIGHKN